MIIFANGIPFKLKIWTFLQKIDCIFLYSMGLSWYILTVLQEMNQNGS